MKGFGTFDTTNTLYGSFYSRQQDPITNIPKFSKPDMEEQYYNQTLEMQKGYFNRYAHLYPDPTGKPIDNPIDARAFKEEDVPRPVPDIQAETLQQPELQQEQCENVPIQKPHVFAHEMPEKESAEEPVMKTFHRNYEAQQE